ncbi:MAG: hypothetical protein K9K32_05755 [Halanaerobiales bacterium]|nr:hypothetical protein [Halanaerobiales bacterium]
MATSQSRGHRTEYINGRWVYSDTKEPINFTERPCANCGYYPTKEGHDYCLGTLPGVRNACCGHGDIEEAYVQFLDGFSIHGKNAVTVLEVLKKYNKRRKND